MDLPFVRNDRLLPSDSLFWDPEELDNQKFYFLFPLSTSCVMSLPVLFCVYRENLRSMVASLQQSISSTLELSSMVQFVLGDGNGSLLASSHHVLATPAPPPAVAGQSGVHT